MSGIRFIAFADLHYDYIHDGKERLLRFTEEIRSIGADFIVQLGDFCFPTQENQELLDLLNSTGLPLYHIIGNHDTARFSKEDVMHFLGMENSMYSFVRGPFKLIFLDTCFIKNEDSYEPFSKMNYAVTKGLYPVIPDDELLWLDSELNCDSPYIVLLSHHSLDNRCPSRGVCNREAVLDLLGDRALICISGHDHGDEIRKLGETWYFSLNSMSFTMFSPEFEHYRYSKDTHERYPFIKHMVLYSRPLYSVIEISEKGEITINGMKGGYQTITPEELFADNTWKGRRISPSVSSLIQLRVFDNSI